jgi:uncharacterized YccA/Bax inhibitor family protein
MRTSNPINSEKAYAKSIAQKYEYGTAESESMTVNGAVNKTMLLLAIVFATAAVSWTMPNPIFIYGGMGLGFVCAIVLAFKQQWAPYLAPVYAVFQGLFLGGVSSLVNGMFSNGAFWGGIVFQAISITVAILFVMLMVYKAGWIKVTDQLRNGIMIATMAVGVVYLASFLLSFAGIQIPYIHEGGTIGLLFSGAVIVIATLNLLLDFQLFFDGERMGAPKYMEWYAAFGLLVTLLWLYLEILRLLMKLQSRD